MRAFFSTTTNNTIYRAIPSAAPRTRSKKTFSVLEFYQQAGYIYLKLDQKSDSFKRSLDEQKNQQQLRYIAFKLIHGQKELKKQKKLKSFRKNLKSKEIKKKKLKEKIIKNKSIKIIKEKNKDKKNDTVQVTKTQPIDINLLIGINQYIDNNTTDYPDDLKRSLSIELGLTTNKFKLSYEYRFLNLTVGSTKVLEVKSHLLNFNNILVRKKVKGVKTNINSKLTLGQMAYQDISSSNESSLVFGIGTEAVINSTFKIGIQYEKIPNISVDSTLALYFGIGWNI